MHSDIRPNAGGRTPGIDGFSSSAQNIRLMPLGASITEGFRSSTGDGYRGPLWKQLNAEVDSVDFVGSKQNGSMSDPDNEGHGGLRIDQIAGLANAPLTKYRPNVVTLLVGTNDMGQDFQVNTAPERLGALVDQILVAAPDATVLVSEIVPSANSATQRRTETYNARIPGVVQSRANAGKHVAFVSLASVTAKDLDKDGIHPTDAGYLKIANAMNAVIQKVILNGWIKDPVANGAPINNGAHVLIPQHAPSMALDNFGGRTQAGNPVGIWGINGQSNQSWVFSNVNVKPAGYYNIAVSNSAFCLTANGSAVNLQACSGTPAQAWRVTASGSHYSLSPASNTALCLDVSGGKSAPKTPVLAWKCGGQANQQWTIR